MTFTNPRATPHVFVVALLAAAGGGCDSIECGDGTIEVDGVCMPASASAPDADSCGEGTHYDDTLLACVPDLPPTVCDDATTDPIVGPDGVITCEGSGGPGGCFGDISCPAPTPPAATLCGRIVDTETGERIEAEGATGQPCTEATADGPCALSVAPYDPLAFVADPTGTAPLMNDGIVLDDCGRYRIENVRVPANGFMAVAVDDAGATDAHALTGIAFPITTGQRQEGDEARATRRTTDVDWTMSAGMPFGATTFAERGVYVPIFVHGEDRVEGVVITAGGATQPDTDFYFEADPDFPGTHPEPWLSSVDAALTSTTATGAGLLVDTPLTMHSGTGSEPEGCVWPSDLAASPAGVVFFSLREAHGEAGPEEPCP